jgi:hypothetical protein
MAQLEHPMALFKHLDKTNCRECSEATCLAFAAAVYKGVRQPGDCPRLDPEIVSRFRGETVPRNSLEQEAEEAIARMRQAVATVDLSEAAERLGGGYSRGRLTLKLLGKDVSVDAEGRIFTDIHVHEWVVGPLLRYLVEGEGRQPSGNWVPLRELEGGKDWYRLFGQRCEKPLKKIADTYTDLFEDMVHLFNGRRVGEQFASDISVVLHPLPRVPLLFCYWRPEEGMASDLHLFFDDTAVANVGIESLYTLGAGLALMFEKITRRHGGI